MAGQGIDSRQLGVELRAEDSSGRAVVILISLALVACYLGWLFAVTVCHHDALLEEIMRRCAAVRKKETPLSAGPDAPFGSYRQIQDPAK